MSDQEHRWKKINIKGSAGFKWPICARCDLVLLRNAASANRAKKPCVGQLVTVTAPKTQVQKDMERL